MSEVIPFTPEAETTPERFLWDTVIRSLEEISDLNSDVDLFEELEYLRDENEEDAINLVFTRLVETEAPPGESSKLKQTMQFMKEMGLVEEDLS